MTLSPLIVMITLLVAFSAADPHRATRGIAIRNLSLYRPDENFRCFDESRQIPFDKVNDDYCDCPDGSDEPGTSACPNMRFHCANIGYRPRNIHSSKVNDGVCDCCDGSDEYGVKVMCVNTCHSLGESMREEHKKKHEQHELGHAVHKEYASKYDDGKKEHAVRLSEIDQLISESEIKVEEVKLLKEEAEILEKEAIAKHDEEWEAAENVRKQEEELKGSSMAFAILDMNNDNAVCPEEIQKYPQFDMDSDGTVSESEALEHLEGMSSVDSATFYAKIWPNIKDVFNPMKHKEWDEPTTHAPTMQNEPDPYVDNYDDENESGDEEEKENFDYANLDSPDKPSIPDKPEYNEETLALIESARQLRSQHSEVEKAHKSLTDEKVNIENVLKQDYGPNGSFYALRDECFEYEEHEYIYRLCLFGQSTQKAKSSHSSTTLGRFSHWNGPDHDLYSSQLYSDGDHCWNGPARSTHVAITCGAENKLLGASEPNRCEYHFRFMTPAACHAHPGDFNSVQWEEEHDEL